MIASPYNIILMIIAFAAVVVGIIAWFATAANYFMMRANRTDSARWFVRLLPWWFILEGKLDARGMEFRGRFIRSLLLFLAAIIVLAAIILGSLAYCHGQQDCLVVRLR